MVSNRRGTSRGGWTKHTSPNRQLFTTLDKTQFTSGFIHQVRDPNVQLP